MLHLLYDSKDASYWCDMCRDVTWQKTSSKCFRLLKEGKLCSKMKSLVQISFRSRSAIPQSSISCSTGPPATLWLAGSQRNSSCWHLQVSCVRLTAPAVPAPQPPQHNTHTNQILPRVKASQPKFTDRNSNFFPMPHTTPTLPDQTTKCEQRSPKHCMHMCMCLGATVTSRHSDNGSGYLPWMTAAQSIQQPLYTSVQATHSAIQGYSYTW
jgi:hypothetical protein